MENIIALGVMFVVVVSLVAYALRGTSMWWVPGTLMLVAAFMAMMAMGSTRGDIGGMQAMANGVLGLGAVGLLVGGSVAFIVGSPRRDAATKSPTPPEPVEPLAKATVVSERRA
jgi:hypothetical protein